MLDADPDHETPCPVVEYVDGPSLADVLREQGARGRSSGARHRSGMVTFGVDAGAGPEVKDAPITTA